MCGVVCVVVLLACAGCHDCELVHAPCGLAHAGLLLLQPVGHVGQIRASPRRHGHVDQTVGARTEANNPWALRVRVAEK